MNRQFLILLAAAGSAALLLGALGFQHLGGLAPCEMCLWQRWPHGAAIALGALGLVLPWMIVPLLGAVAAATTAGIGLYHTGVERDWWEGATACSTGDLSSIGQLSTQDLLAQIMDAPLVRCDVVAWEFLSLSMASWNAALSAGLAVIWVLAAMRRA